MIMNKDERPSFLRGKGAAVGIVICFVAVIAMVGAYTFNNYQDRMDEQVAKAEEQAEKLTEDNSEETTADDIVLPEEDNSAEDMTEAEDQPDVQTEEIPADTEESVDDTGQQAQPPRQKSGSVRTAHLPGRQAARYLSGTAWIIPCSFLRWSSINIIRR